MRKNKKIIILSAVLIVSICLVVIVLHFKAKTDSYVPNPTRPEYFPEILVAPVNSMDRDYSVPSQKVPHVYSLSFIVEDPYPSEATKAFFRNNLISNGWQPLKYQLLNPQLPKSTMPWTKLLKARDKENKPPFHWEEDWINKKNQAVNLICAYVVLEEQKPDLNRLRVNSIFFDRDSWIRPFLQRYKQLHPEEFEYNANTLNNQ